MRKLVGPLVAAAFLVGGTAGSAAANDDGPNFTFGASTSFAYDFNTPNAGTGGANPSAQGGYNLLSYSSMEQDQSFNIDLVQLGISGQRGRLRYGASIDFGDLAKFAGDSSDGDVALQTAWIGYDADPVGFTVGRIPTPIGFEVLEPWGNPNISRSYNWQFVPINHDALTVQGGSDMFEVMIGVANSFTVADDPITSIPANDSNSDKTFLGSGNVAIAEYLNLYVSGIVGREGANANGGTNTKVDVAMVNFIASGNATVGNDIGLRYAAEFNGRQDDPRDPGTTLSRMWGVAAYLGATFGPTGLDLRYEYVDDGGILFNDVGAVGGLNPNGTQAQSITTTGSWSFVEGVEFRLEYRYDTANNDLYAKNSNAFTKSSNNTVQAQIVWYPEI